MNLQQLSSGDLIADRRAEYAQMLSESGDAAGAADLMTQALELVPDWAAGWFQLADYEQKSGRSEAAVVALNTVVALSPGDIFGAGLKLASMGRSTTQAKPSSLYVERLFDDYADRFDEALVARLDYSVPEKLAALILAHVPQVRFARTVDLGCGTGLFGARIRAHTDRLEGYDLSANMLTKAREKNLYDHLGRADLSLSPEASGLFSDTGETRHRADLVSAADVLLYLGRLDMLFASVAKLISPSGLFAFSVEDAGADGDNVLRPSLRYAHSGAHIEALCLAHGLTVVDRLSTTLRKDGGNPIVGILFLARAAA